MISDPKFQDSTLNLKEKGWIFGNKANTHTQTQIQIQLQGSSSVILLTYSKSI